MDAEVEESLDLEKALKAIASPRRLQIMQSLQDVATARSGWVYYRRNERAVDALKHQLLAL